MIPAKKIVCPTDFSEAASAAVQHARELAAHFGSELVLVNVVPVVPALPNDPNWVLKIPEYEASLHADATQNLRELAASIEAKGVCVRTVVGHGDAASEIVRIAQDEGADMIVIATHGHTGWRHVAFGSVAEKVVRRAQCPVLTYPVAAERHAVHQA
ncbi:MAG: universal stress protein [Candidatus Korobacteraceae bacterium]